MVTLRYLAFAAALALPVPASAAVVIQIDKSSQRMTVSKDGQRLYTWPVSTGKRGFSTPSGSYKAFRMEKDHFSKEWDDAPMPHSIFFTKDGHAIHGSYEVKRIGTPASHGCVRLAPENAAILFNLVKADGVLNTQVVLSGTARPRAVRHKIRTPRRRTQIRMRRRRIIWRAARRTTVSTIRLTAAPTTVIPRRPIAISNARRPTISATRRTARRSSPATRNSSRPIGSSSPITGVDIISSSRSPLTARVIAIRIMTTHLRRIITGADLATGGIDRLNSNHLS
jgi:hypothetical protein